MSPHPLNRRIALLRTRVRRMLLIYGLSTVVATVLGALIVLGLGDYLIRFQDRGIRVMCWLALLGVLAWSCLRCLARPLAHRFGDVDLALRLQERFPVLGDRLVSAVEFLRQSEDDPMAGSAALRRVVIAQAAAETDRLDWSEALDRGRPIRAVLAAAAVALLAGLFVALAPAASRIAMARLLHPLGDLAWPQTTHLALRESVARVARGQPFEVEVIDAQGARLPSEVLIHYRFPDGEPAAGEEVQRMQLLAGAMVARRENVSRSFEFRIKGGDDLSMPWMPVEVLEPPAVGAISVELFPPPYSGWPPEKIGAGGSIRALAGTRVRLLGEATKPLRWAAMCLEGGREMPARVGQDGLRFAVDDFTVEKSGAYWFKLTDRDGLSGGADSRWDIRAVPDLPPSVRIEQPTSNLFVTPRAVVPLRAVVKDDLAIHDVTLVVARSDQPQQEGSVKILFSGPPSAAPRAASALADPDASDRRLIEHRWDLEELKLAPGTQVTFHVAATDYKPQTGKSEPRRLSIITAEELQERIAARQNVVLAELTRVLKMQRDNRSQVESLEIRVRETQRLAQVDVDRLQAAELNQRQVGRSLTSRSDGVPMHILSLLADLENNRLDSPDFQRRMQSLLAEIERLEREHLPPLGRQLTLATKTAQIRLQEDARSRPRDAATADALRGALAHQDQVIASLEAMLAQLRQWDDYRRFHRDLTQLLREQEELNRNAADVGRHTLTRELKDLSPQESADLKVLAARQLDLARRLDRIEQEMEQAAGPLRESDPMAAEIVSDALDEARRLAIGTAMRSAGSQLEENRVGQAARGHQQVVESLQEVLDILANRRQQELARLLKKYREAEADLASLARQQAELRKQIERGGPAPGETQKAELDELGRRQEALRKEAERLARRLERLMAEEAGRATQQAAQQMAEAGRAAAQGDRGSAGRQAEAAEKKLEEASRQLAARRLHAQAELAMEQLARLEDALKHLEHQQRNVLDETRRLDALGQKETWTRGQAASLHELAGLQQSLEAETARMAESLAGTGGFHLALSTAGSAMDRAAALLDRRRTGPPTQQAEQDSLARLGLVLKAVEPERPGSSADGGGQSGGAGPQAGQPGGVQALAEIKLLKLLQEDVNLRTRQLQDAAGQAAQVTDEQKGQFALLSEEQGRLADLVLELLKPVQRDAPGPDEPPKPPKEKPENRRPAAPEKESP